MSSMTFHAGCLRFLLLRVMALWYSITDIPGDVSDQASYYAAHICTAIFPEEKEKKDDGKGRKAEKEGQGKEGRKSYGNGLVSGILREIACLLNSTFRSLKTVVSAAEDGNSGVGLESGFATDGDVIAFFNKMGLPDLRNKVLETLLGRKLTMREKAPNTKHKLLLKGEGLLGAKKGDLRNRVFSVRVHLIMHIRRWVEDNPEAAKKHIKELRDRLRERALNSRGCAGKRRSKRKSGTPRAQRGGTGSGPEATNTLAAKGGVEKRKAAIIACKAATPRKAANLRKAATALGPATASRMRTQSVAAREAASVPEADIGSDPDQPLPPTPMTLDMGKASRGTMEVDSKFSSGLSEPTSDGGDSLPASIGDLLGPAKGGDPWEPACSGDVLSELLGSEWKPIRDIQDIESSCLQPAVSVWAEH